MPAHRTHRTSLARPAPDETFRATLLNRLASRRYPGRLASIVEKEPVAELRMPPSRSSGKSRPKRSSPFSGKRRSPPGVLGGGPRRAHVVDAEPVGVRTAPPIRGLGAPRAIARCIRGPAIPWASRGRPAPELMWFARLMDQRTRDVIDDLAARAAEHDDVEPDRLRRWRVLEESAGRFLGILVRAARSRDVVEIGT